MRGLAVVEIVDVLPVEPSKAQFLAGNIFFTAVAPGDSHYLFYWPLGLLCGEGSVPRETSTH